MKDKQKDQNTPAAKGDRENRTGNTPVAKPGFKTAHQDDEEEGSRAKSYSPPLETGKTSKPGESKGQSSREDDEDDDQERRTGEEQDEENEEIEPSRRIKTPVADQHNEDSKSPKSNTGNSSRRF